MTDEQTTQANQVFAELRQSALYAYEAAFHARPDLGAGGQAQISFQAMYVAAMIDVAASIGIDGGLTQEQFIAIANESYERNEKAAPRFG